jgi:lipopolysaccharide export system protein LptA
LDDDDLAVELNSEQDRRARLAQGLTRVVADTIVTDSRGRSLTATGRVESTMLPEDNAASLQGMFRTDKTVHFISAELHGEDAGGELVFSGNVRGWQGEQNLSAQTVVLERTSGSLRAHGGVGTRFPRAREGAAAASADFVQVTAATLDYDREAYQAVYRGGVRVAVAEGWIECEVLTVTQGRNTGEFERLLAAGQVRIEFLGIDDGRGAPTQRTTGRSDRLVYVPAEKTLWMYGDEQRAVLQRGGEQAGTSEGRVLTYRLDDGTLSVVEGGSVKVPPPVSTAQESETPE